MFKPLLAFVLVLGSLLVLVPQPATAFTVKLLSNTNTFGEKHVNALNEKSKGPIDDILLPGLDVKSNTRENVPTSDELYLESLAVDSPLTEEQIDAYLIKFGYLVPPANGTITHHERRDAIKEYQRFSRLEQSGFVDSRTRRKMKTYRCGMADPISNNKFANFDAKGTRKWRTKSLTYKIVDYSKKLPENIVREWTEKAFKMWSDVSQLTFTEVSKVEDANLRLKFTPRKHGDGYPFDGEGGVLAHAFYPENGDIHLEEEENWTIESKKGTNLLFVLVHEIGHALGLGHSEVNNAIMEPYYNGYIPNLALDKDDIAGIQFLYGKPTVAPPKPKPPTQAPATKAPPTKAPATKAPPTEAPATKAPPTDAPTTKAPATNAPRTTFLASRVPNTKYPATRAPSPTYLTSKAPFTRGPTTEEPYNTTTLLPEPTSEPSPPGRNLPCPFRFWASMTVGNRTFGFFRRLIYEINSNGRIIQSKSIRYIFPGAPRVVGAAAYNDVTGHTFLFWGRWVWRYTDHEMDKGFPKKLKNYIRAAVCVDGQLIAFSFTHIHYLDEDTLEDYVDGEVSISDEYPGLPYSIRAAISYDDGLAYVLYTRKIYKLDMYTGEMNVEKSCYGRRG